MEFRFETDYTPKSMTVMAKALRKTVRKKHSRRSHVFGGVVAVLGIVLALSAEEINFRLVLTLTAVAAILLALIFEDRLNGYIAYKRMLPGMDSSKVNFHEDGYHSETPIGASDFPYDNIRMIAEDATYFILIFSASHAQLYDKRTLTGGSCEEFKEFLLRRTGIQCISI